MSAARHLRILLALKHAGYIGVYRSLVEELARRGHRVHVAYLGHDREGVATLERLAADPRISHGRALPRSDVDGWSSVAWLARALGDLGRYADPRFEAASALRTRMAAKVESHLASSAGFDPLVRRLARRRARRLAAARDAELAEREIRLAQRLEAAVPTSGRVTSFLRELAPDVVLVSPLVDLASPLLDTLRSARRLGLPTGICDASWDNLTSKGLLRVVPERVFVWNEIQRREASELHGIPADRIVATGAARFDEWFEQRPTRSRAAFVRQVGLDPERPFLLYLCSSAFVAPGEVGAVTRWLATLRGSDDELLRSAGVVVRPHPKRFELWRDVDLSPLGNAVVWPRDPGALDPAQARAEFYDSSAHSAAGVGANTSAMIEAAIAGKSVYALLSDDFAQEETIHFHYLLHENGGFLHVAASPEQHLAQLAAALRSGDRDAERTRRFVVAFVRPRGLDRSATAIYADAVEELASLPVADPERPSVTTRALLAPIALSSTLALASSVGVAALRSRLVDRRRAGGQSPRARAVRA